MIHRKGLVNQQPTPRLCPILIKQMVMQVKPASANALAVADSATISSKTKLIVIIPSLWLNKPDKQGSLAISNEAASRNICPDFARPLLRRNPGWTDGQDRFFSGSLCLYRQRARTGRRKSPCIPALSQIEAKALAHRLSRQHHGPRLRMDQLRSKPSRTPLGPYRFRNAGHLAY